MAPRIFALGAALAAAWAQTPIQLVRPSSDHTRLEVNEEGVSLLSNVHEPLEVVTAVGAFHSGKSFMLNNAMGIFEHPGRDGFSIGDSVDATTMGIWAWSQPARPVMRSSEGRALPGILFLDTEGFGARNVSSEYDAKVFAVSALLSSHLLYNSMKSVDSSAVDALEILAHKTQLFHLKAALQARKRGGSGGANEGGAAGQLLDASRPVFSFPDLTWTVQDWSLRLKPGQDASGYIRSMIDGARKVDPADAAEAQLGGLTAIFPSVRGFVLPAPTVLSADMARLDELRTGELAEGYREAVSALRNHILDCIARSVSLREETQRQAADVRALPAGATSSSLGSNGAGGSRNSKSSGSLTTTSHGAARVPADVAAKAVALTQPENAMLHLPRARSGAEIVRLLRVLVDAANSGFVPQLSSSWGALIERQAKDAKEAAVSQLEIGISGLHTPSDPTPAVQFEPLLRAQATRTTALYAHMVAGLSGRAVTAQQAELAARVQEMAGRATKDNLMHIHAHCEQRTRQFKDAFDSFLGQLPVRQASKSFASAVATRRAKVVEDFHARVAARYGEHADTGKRDLDRYLSAATDAALGRNRAALDALMDKARWAAIDAFRAHAASAIDQYAGKPLSTSQLRGLLAGSRERATSIFERDALVAKEESAYSDLRTSALAACQSEWEAKIVATNDARLVALARRTAETLRTAVEKNYAAATKPMEEEVQATLEREQRASAATRYAEQMAPYADQVPYARGQTELLAGIDACDTDLEAANVRAWNKVFKMPLAQARERVSDVAGTFWFVFRLHSHALQVGRQKVLTAVNGGSDTVTALHDRVRISERMLTKALKAWVEGKEMAPIIETPAVRGWGVIALASALAGASAYMYVMTRWGPQAAKKPLRHEPQPKRASVHAHEPYMRKDE